MENTNNFDITSFRDELEAELKRQFHLVHYAVNKGALTQEQVNTLALMYGAYAILDVARNLGVLVDAFVKALETLKEETGKERTV